MVHRKILLLTGIGWMFDAMDQGMVSGVAALGASLSGMVADKLGRRTVIMYTLIIYGIASVLSGLAVNYPMLLILRFFTGFGLGGELPAASTLIREYSPTKTRSRIASLSSVRRKNGSSSRHFNAS